MSLRGALTRPTNKSPVPLVSRQQATNGVFGLFKGGRQDDNLMKTYEDVGTIFAIVNRLAVSVASVEWKLYRKAASGLEEDRKEVTKHAIIDLWNKPNAFMTGRHFREAAQQHVDLVGETDILYGRARGIKAPIELWPVRPDKITPVPDPFTFLKGYIYKSPDGQMIPLGLDECSKVMMPNPRDPYRGIGPVQSVLTDADSSKYSAEWNKAFFENSAEPGGVIEVETGLNDMEFDRLQAQWSETHQGVSKAHRVAILENNAKWVSNSFTQRDMQFAELRTLSRDTILEAFGFPRPMLGITENVNLANAEAAEYLYSKYLLTPRLDRWKDWLNFVLLPFFAGGDSLEWDYEDPVESSTEQDVALLAARSTAAVAMVGAGFDEVDTLEWLDMPEIAYKAPAPPTIMAPPGSDPNAPADPNAPKPDPNAPKKADPAKPDPNAPKPKAPAK